MRRPSFHWLLGALLSALVMACESEGLLYITLDLPQDKDLNPFGDNTRLVQLKVSAYRRDDNGQLVRKTLWADWSSEPPSTVDFGEIPPGYYDGVELFGYAGDGTLVGYGRILQLNLVEGRRIDVPSLRFRKPLAYLCGGLPKDTSKRPTIVRLDTSYLSGQQLILPLELHPNAVCTGLATTPDGRYLLALTSPNPKVYWFETNGQDEDSRNLPIPDGAAQAVPQWLAVAENGRVVVSNKVLFPGQDWQYALVLFDVVELAGRTDASLMPRPPVLQSTGPLAKPVFAWSSDGLVPMALTATNSLDATTDCSMARGASDLVALDLNTGAELARVPLPAQVSSLAYDEEHRAVWFTMPCLNQGTGAVSALAVDALPFDPTVVPVAFDHPVLVVTGDWGVAVLQQGIYDGQNSSQERGVAISFWSWPNIAIESGPIPVPVDYLRVHLGPDGATGGQTVLTVSIPPSRVLPISAAATAGGSRMGILFATEYVMSSEYRQGDLTVGQMRGITFSYVTVDVLDNPPGTPAQVTPGVVARTYCEVRSADGSDQVRLSVGSNQISLKVSCEPSSVGSLDIWMKDSNQGQFKPTDLAMLYGRR